MSYLDDPALLAKRDTSRWTAIVMAIAMVQFFAYIAGFYLVIRFLLTGEWYLAASISVWIKIALMWAVTVTGMFWERDIIGKWFLGKEFFWEDIGNLVAMITHNAYFVAVGIGLDQRSIMWVMLFAYVTYIFNFVQWVILGVQSYLRRVALKRNGDPGR